MERLTMLVNSHLLDNGKLDKEYDLNNKIQLNEYSCMDIPNAVYNKLGELEDVLEKYGINNLDDFIKEYSSRNIKLANDNYALKQELADLQHKLKVAEIATKLACERVKYFEEMQDREMGFENLFGYESNYDLQGIIEQYKDQAEKEVKGE